MTDSVCAVVVTHRRLEELAVSLRVLAAQHRPLEHLIVVDNDCDDAVRDLVAAQPIPTTYVGSRRNLGGAGGFALGILHALAWGADWIWLADDDGRPAGPEVLGTLLECALRNDLAEVSPMVCDLANPELLAFPLRRGLVWRRRVSELRAGGESGGGAPGDGDGGEPGDGGDLLAGIASLFNGALFRASTVEAVGVPDLRLFVRGDEVEVHRRLVRSGLAFGTCLNAVYLHPQGGNEFKPILGGRMHTQYPDDPVKRFFTYRNRGYLLAQPGLRKLVPQEWLRFGWFFLVSRRDPAGLRDWVRLRRLGRREEFFRGERSDGGREPGERSDGDENRASEATGDENRASEATGTRTGRAKRWEETTGRAKRRETTNVTFTDAAAQSRTFYRARKDLVDGFGRRELWFHLGWQDIKQRYRRSVLGPFWITIATGTMAVALGGLYSKLFHLQLSEHLPYVTLGLIIWNLINAAILEGADVFVANEGLIRQLPTPLSVHVYRLVWRQIILFGHNIIIFVVIAAIFPQPWKWTDLMFIPALFLIMLNCVWVALCFGILATRYRDISPLLFSLVQLLFYMTPIIWNDQTLRDQGADGWARIIEFNPLLHYVDIVRAPLLGADQELRHWVVVIVLTIVGWSVAMLAMRQYRARVPYWV